MAEPSEIIETTKVERNDAIRFAALTVANLDFIEAAWRSAQDRGLHPPVHLVAQTVNSLLGLIVFTCEREYVRFTLTERLDALKAKGWPDWKFHLGGSPADTLGDLIYHIRNGASHARISFSSDSHLPSEVEITIEDAHPKTKKVYWRVSTSAADLLNFCRLYGRHVDDIIG